MNGPRITNELPIAKDGHSTNPMYLAGYAVVDEAWQHSAKLWYAGEPLLLMVAAN